MAGFTANASGCYLTMGRSVPDRTDFDLLPAPHSTRVSAWQSQVNVNHREWSRSVQLVGAPTYRLRSGHRLRVSADPRCLRIWQQVRTTRSVWQAQGRCWHPRHCTRFSIHLWSKVGTCGRLQGRRAVVNTHSAGTGTGPRVVGSERFLVVGPQLSLAQAHQLALRPAASCSTA